MRISDWSSDVCSSDLVDNSSGDVDASFDYRLTDGDGDTDEATQPISIEDGADPTAGGPLSLSVDEDDLPGGTDQQPEPGGDRIHEGMLGFTAGSDDLTSFAFSPDLSKIGRASCRERVCQYV